jgi:MFS family permease
LRLTDSRRVGEAQVLVGSALVLGSAMGPLLSGLVVEQVGYRGMFALLAAVGAAATALVAAAVPETIAAHAATGLAPVQAAANR